ncbi:MAG: DMT family transporter [Hyphomonadaceae bacterium]
MPARPLLDIASILICAVAWGTTWFAITLQFGVVDPIVSIVYRFGLAAGLLFIWCLARKEPLALTRPQHWAAFGVGAFTFALDYSLVYSAEERVASGIVAVLFASLAFFNLIAFRFAFGEHGAATTWFAALLGVLGVGVLSWGEIVHANMDARALAGFLMALAAVIVAALGNVFARRGELAGAPVAALSGWAMFYGAALLAAFAIVTGRVWAFELSWRYALSLGYLTIIGSFLAFLLYYGLARRRGYGLASYISALTPPIAMIMSGLFEAKTWGAAAFVGIALVMAGQALLLRTRRA